MFGEARDLIEKNDAQGMPGVFDEMRSQQLMEKWDDMLTGVDGDWTKKCMAQIYENQMVSLSRMMNKPALMESTYSSAVPDLVKFIFPVIRRVWPNLIANNLASVQPTTSPVGGIFYWKWLYGTTKGTVTAGDEMIANFDDTYSSEEVHGEAIGAGPAANFVGALAWSPVKPYGVGQIGVRFEGTDVGGNTLTIYDGDGSGTLTGDVGAGSTVVYANGNYNITFSANVTAVKAYYFFSMEGQSNNVPQVNIDVTLEAIKVYSRKLKGLWSSEVVDDMRAVLGMDIEPELTGGLANQITLGKDREIIRKMYNSGTTNLDTFDAAVPAGRNQVDHYRNIMTTLEKVSGEINRRLHRGPGNFIITGPDVQPIFGALETHGDLARVFTPPPTPQGQGVTGRPAFTLPTAPSGYGVFVMGTLQHKWTVIIDPFFTAGKILVGLKGPSFVDAGVVYSPYVPLEMTGTFLDPADWTLRKGLRTRYFSKLVNKDFYGVITVTNTP